MDNRNSPLSPELWLNDLFASKAVQQGGERYRAQRGADALWAAEERRGAAVVWRDSRAELPLHQGVCGIDGGRRVVGEPNGVVAPPHAKNVGFPGLARA